LLIEQLPQTFEQLVEPAHRLDGGLFRGGELALHFASQPARGEFVIVLAGRMDQHDQKWSEAQLTGAIRQGAEAGEPPSQLAARLAQQSGWKRREVYKRITS